MPSLDRCENLGQELQKCITKIKHQKSDLTNNQVKAVKGISEHDKIKILKLFNYEKWEIYMKWID